MRAVAVLVCVTAVGCTSSSATPPPPAMDAAASDSGGDGPGTQDGQPGGACVVRPACEACLGDAGACCQSPNPSPPPEYAVACGACPGDAGSTYITYGCTSEADCGGSRVCCIQKDMGGNVRSFCASSCDATMRQAQLCDTNATMTACAAASPCTKASSDAWNIPHCIGTCGGVAPPP
jgi:hypothetical protein